MIRELLFKCLHSRSLFSLYLAFLSFVTLLPKNETTEKWRWYFLETHLERIVNLVLLAPLAAFLITLFRMSVRTSLLLCLTTTVAIESIQNLIPGRVSDYKDVLLNSFGAIIAILILARFRHIFKIFQEQ